MNETDHKRRAHLLRAIALKCQRGLTDIRDAAALEQIANELDPSGTGIDSESGANAERAAI